jgi:hypothetical protein
MDAETSGRFQALGSGWGEQLAAHPCRGRGLQSQSLGFEDAATVRSPGGAGLSGTRRAMGTGPRLPSPRPTARAPALKPHHLGRGRGAG